MEHLAREQLEAGLSHILAAPKEFGSIEMIVRRPAENQREVVQSCILDPLQGLIGDNWLQRGCSQMADGSAHPDMQLNLMNSRVIDLLAQTRHRWPLAGDQFYVDLDLSAANLLPGNRLAIGPAVIEVTAEPHLGCKKFAERFGHDAMRFVNSSRGKQHNLRGINARVLQAGAVNVGDTIRKLTV
ncbi:MAG: MOSC domain-containing protein [Gammaproteobacteria bacterium]|nr:MOSC domain-containing protein [Gammaproteobacteria bacterium]